MEQSKEIVIIKDGRAFRYRFDDVCIEAGEIAAEIGQFKAKQIENQPENFDDIIRSKGAEWLHRICAMIFVEVVNYSMDNDAFSGTAVEFNFDDADTKTKVWFGKKLKMTDRIKLQEAVQDFFTGIGLGTIGSLLFQRPSKQDERRIQLALQVMKLNADLNKSDTSKTYKKRTPSTKKTN